MEAMLVSAKRVSKTSPRDFHNCFRSATHFLSTAYELAQGGFAVAGKTRTSNDPIGEGVYEVKQEAPDVDEGRASGPSEFVAETANEGVKKAGEQAENVGDTAKETMDGNIHEDPAVVEVHKIDDSIDTQEYRSIEEVHKAGGYDKVH